MKSNNFIDGYIAGFATGVSVAVIVLTLAACENKHQTITVDELLRERNHLIEFYNDSIRSLSEELKKCNAISNLNYDRGLEAQQLAAEAADIAREAQRMLRECHATRVTF